MSKKGYQKQLPFAPVIASRVPVFSVSSMARTNKSQSITWEKETQWGKVNVKGALDQTHRDVLDAFMKTALDSNENESTGDLMLLIDLYQVRKTLSVKGKSINSKQILKKLEELSQTSLMIWDYSQSVDVPVHRGEIINGYDEVPIGIANTKSGQFNGKHTRSLWKVSVSSTWFNLMKKTLVYRYNDNLKIIRSMKRDISKAVTRFMLTHVAGSNYLLKDVFLAVASEKLSIDMLKKWNTRIFDDRALMLSCGVDLTDDKKIKRINNTGVNVYNETFA